jgi:hypothetical protein
MRVGGLKLSPYTMGLLSKLARSSARATGRALSAHVVPDSLLPSWKTRKTLQTGYSLLSKAGRKTKKKAAAPAKKKPLSIGGFQVPKPKAPAKKFDKNAWSTGRGLPSGVGYGERPPSRSASPSGQSLRQRASKLRGQLSDLRREPRAVAQMGLDLLEVEYKRKRQSFLSKVRNLDKKL